MSTKIKAADDIRNLARLFKNMQSVADELEKIGQMEQVTLESTRAVEKARGELAAVNAEIESAESSLSSKQMAAQQCVVDASAYAEKLVRDAKDQVEQISAQANAKATAIVVDARIASDKIAAGAHALKSEADQAIAAANDKLAKINDEISDKTAELATLNNAIEKSRKKIKSLLDE